ncbi:MAG: hypothetical protein KQH57_03365 [Actinomycetales bacterium]|nr:hypothetical protein [Actinomycetales bacterium]
MGLDLARALSELHDDDALHPAPLDPGVLAATIRRRRALRAGALGAAGLTAAAGAVLVAMLVGTPSTPPPAAPGPSSSSVPAPSPSATATQSPTPEASSTTQPELPAAPTTAVALTGSGALVVLDSSSGQVLDTVLTGSAPDDWAKVGLAVDADRKVAYMSTATQQVVAVSLADAHTEVLGAGELPALSPDGGTLAWTGPDDSGNWGLVLLDLSTRRSHFIRDTASNPARWYGGLGWSRDGSMLYVTEGWPEGTQILAIDPAVDTTLQEGRVIGGSYGAGPTWSWPQELADGRLAVATATYDSSRDIGDTNTDWHVLLVDPGSAAVLEDLTPLDGYEVAQLATDPVGDSLLALLGHQDGSAPDGLAYRLVRWDGDQSVTTLATDVVAVAW